MSQRPWCSAIDVSQAAERGRRGLRVAVEHAVVGVEQQPGSNWDAEFDAASIHQGAGSSERLRLDNVFRAGDRTRTGDVQLGKLRGYYAVSLYSLITSTCGPAIATRLPSAGEHTERGGHSWAPRNAQLKGICWRRTYRFAGG